MPSLIPSPRLGLLLSPRQPPPPAEAAAVPLIAPEPSLTEWADARAEFEEGEAPPQETEGSGVVGKQQQETVAVTVAAAAASDRMLTDSSGSGSGVAAVVVDDDGDAIVSPLSSEGAGEWVMVTSTQQQQQQGVGEGDDDDDALSYSTALGDGDEEEWEGPEAREFVDRWGFVIRPDDPQASRASLHRRSLRQSAAMVASQEEERLWRAAVEKEASRATKWLRMLKDWGSFTGKKPQLTKRRIRKGIPDAVRRQAWGLLVGLPDAIAQQPALYDSLLQADRQGSAENREVVDTIERDVDRTFPRHVLFRDHGGEGQGRLRRVLRAYARLDPDVGYCQGMGFIAAMLLTYFPEDEAFHMLSLVMRGPRPTAIRGIYIPGMPKAREMLFVADKLTQRHLPKLHRHLMDQGVDNSMFLTQWFVTLFTNSFPFEVVTRVWDCFLAEGWKVLYRVQLAILTLHDQELRKRDFEGIMHYVKGIPASLDAQELIALAFRLPLKRKEIARWEAEFARLNPTLRVDI